MLAALSAAITATPMVFTMENSVTPVKIGEIAENLADYIPEEMRGAFDYN
jgi:hypothetical protein